MKETIAKFVRNIRINEKSINFLLIFILGFLVGVAMKTEAKKRVTIGYDDYQVSGLKQGFDLMNKIPAQMPEGENAPQPGENANDDSQNNGDAPAQ